MRVLQTEPQNKKLGYLAAVGAYFSWGVLPGYWKALAGVSSFEIIAHRIVWSLLALWAVFRFKKIPIAPLFTKKNLLLFGASGVLIGANWYVYVLAVNTGRVLEASLGYFMNPVFNVMLGYLVFREQFTKLRFLSFLLALTGVVYLTVSTGGLPWISVILVATFSAYGIIRKTAKADAMSGLFLETVVLFIPALVAIAPHAQATLSSLPWTTQLLLIGAGPVTAFPLLWFSVAARNLPLSSLGFLQYISPTLQFSMAVFVYDEHFGHAQLVSFIFIWTGLAIFISETLYRERARRANLSAK